MLPSVPPVPLLAVSIPLSPPPCGGTGWVHPAVTSPCSTACTHPRWLWQHIQPVPGAALLPWLNLLILRSQMPHGALAHQPQSPAQMHQEPPHLPASPLVPSASSAMLQHGALPTPHPVLCSPRHPSDAHKLLCFDTATLSSRSRELQSLNDSSLIPSQPGRTKSDSSPVDPSSRS